MKFKKSQISIFIIIAILILVIFFLFFSKNFNNKNLNVNPDIEPIYNYVDDCLKQVGSASILDTSAYGGYFVSPEISFNEIPYYFKDGKELTPSKEIIEEEIGNYVNTLIDFCINDFEKFKDYEIKVGEINSFVVIEKNKVVFNAKYPISIKKGEKSYDIRTFQTEISTRLYLIYDSIKEIMTEQMKDKDSVCITCLDRISKNNEFYISALNVGNNTIIYTIKDEKVKINDDPLVFSFVNELENIK